MHKSKKLLFIAGVLLLLGGAGVWLVRQYADDHYAILPPATDAEMNARYPRHTEAPPAASSSAPARIDPSRRVRLAIGNVGLGDEAKSRNVSDLVLVDLQNAKGLEMVERQELDKALDELHLNISGLVRAGDAVRAGKLLRADWFLLGTPSVVSGTNVAVIRIVDARTGILRDAAMIPRDGDSTAIAAQLAAFVQQSRQDAAAPRPKTFLAIGVFEDLGLNNRQATLPRDLSAYLTANYQGGGVSLLEREFVSTLLNELYLDLAGLTEEGGTNAATMQAAYWMVNGYYQTYETTGYEVELVLNVQRMFGRTRRFELREKPGEPLFKRVRESIDIAMRDDQTPPGLTRLTEARSQMSAGQEIIRTTNLRDLGNIWQNYIPGLSESEMARKRRNVAEAIRALETALLLDPTNRQVKANLACCLRTPFAMQFDRAQDLYREIVDAPIQDHLTPEAQWELKLSFGHRSKAEKRSWFENAASRAAYDSARDFFQQQARLASEEAALEDAGSEKAVKVAEERLFRDIESWGKEVRDHGGSLLDFYNTGLGKYVEAFGTDTNQQALAANRLAALLPKLQALATNLAPHILAGVVTYQVDTNAPIIAEFERSLAALSSSLATLSNKPPPVPEPEYYLELLAGPVRYWAEEHRLFGLAVKLTELHLQSTHYFFQKIFVRPDTRARLAFDYAQVGEWQKALEAFQGYSNRNVVMESEGPWGPTFTVVHTAKQAAFCREKLGLHVITDPREFNLGKPCLHPHTKFPGYDSLTFLADADGLWIGLNQYLMRIGLDLRTNFITSVSPGSGARVTSLCLGTTNLWIGTSGGLVAFDKATRQTHVFTEKDGLLMNQISALHLAGNTLWIGYGNESRGALGRLDLPTGRFTSYNASLSEKPGVVRPPQRGVGRIHMMPSGEICCLSDRSLFHYQPALNAWSVEKNASPARNNSLTSYATDDERFIELSAMPLVELIIESRITNNAASNSMTRFSRVMTEEDSAIFQQMIQTNGSGMRIYSSSGGSLSMASMIELRTLSDGKRQRLLKNENFPGVGTALALHGHELWVGGLGFVGMVDVEENKIKRLAYIPASEVDDIQIAGGWVWVQFDHHLYRVAN